MASGLEGSVCLIPFLIYFGIYGAICGAVLVFIAFWLWMLVDCLKREFKKSDEKVIWILVILLAQFIGAVIYYFLIKRPDKR